MRRIARTIRELQTQFELHARAAHVLPSVAVLAQRKRPGEVHASYSHIWRKQKLHTSRQSQPVEAYGVRGTRSVPFGPGVSPQVAGQVMKT